MHAEIRKDGFYINDKLVFPAEMRSYSIASIRNDGSANILMTLKVKGDVSARINCQPIENNA